MVVEPKTVAGPTTVAEPKTVAEPNKKYINLNTYVYIYIYIQLQYVFAQLYSSIIYFLIIFFYLYKLTWKIR